MHGPADYRLLREFAEQQSDEAFGALVARYVNLVYSTVLRSAGNADDAQEITQAVFIILARKAGKLSPRVVLSGWLYQTARLTAANFLKGEIRRQRREQEAYMQSISSEAEARDWQQIAPLLDDAMGCLGETDRNAVVLRYFENRTAAEIGAALQMSEETARRRVNRAVEKLRKIFSKRGVNSTTAIISGAISAHSVQTAPAALAKTLAPVAVAKGAAASVSTLSLVKETMKIMTRMKLKMAAMIGVAVLILAGTATTLVAQHSNEINATITYKMLDDASAFAGSFDQSKLVVQVLIKSRNKAVQSSDVQLTIQSAKKGPIAVHVGVDGQMIDFPHDEELRRENPPVVVNQPKGAMRMTIFMKGLPKLEGLTFRYDRLNDAVAELNNGVAKANEIAKASYPEELPALSRFSRKIQSVLFFFPKSSARKARVEIASATGKREYVADASGHLRLTLEKALVAENPEVTLSENPQNILPDPR